MYLLIFALDTFSDSAAVAIVSHLLNNIFDSYNLLNTCFDVVDGFL
jgi:hypothetical protein